MHPAAGIGAIFDEPVFPWRGTLQPFMVDEFSESDEIMLEVTSSYPGVGSGVMPGVGHVYKEALSRYRYLASCGLMVSDTSKGTVHKGIGGPLISYSLNRNDADRTAKGMGIIAEIFLAAGAKEVLTGLPGFPTVKSQADLQALREARFSPGAFKLMAFHPMGTARMGSDPQTSVVDSWGEAHEVPGLYVADGSVFPTCTGVNPQISIMAFATRTATRIVERLGGRPRG
jgi:choline dehydrogenase-like flavoprotein